MQHLSQSLTAPQRQAMEFLQTALPLSDLDCYPADFFLSCVDHALMLRALAPWCASLEEELFYHYVLCPRINDENLTLWQPVFFEALWPRLAGLDGEHRVLEVNRWCHEHAAYEAQDDRTASPLTVFYSGSGRCGEESAFLVAALRSVGVAARQVYAPRWSHCDDNHAWVEVYCNGAWSFLGACEPEPILNRGWFNTAASRAMLVHSRTFGRGHSPRHGALISQEGGVCWYNQTQRYAAVKPYTFTATVDGRAAAGATFTLQVLNEAAYFTIATLIADETGCVQLPLGIGSLHVCAALDGRWAEGDCQDGCIDLALVAPPQGDTDWTLFDALAPQNSPINLATLNGAQKLDRAQALTRGNTLRSTHVARLFDPVRAAQLPTATDLLQGARGNFDVIHAFLMGDSDPRRLRLLRTLSPKDLRDVTSRILEDHIAHTPAPNGSIPAAIYLSYLLCPRVELEPLTPWRGALGQALTDAQRARYIANPCVLWSELQARITIETARVYQPLCWTPAEAMSGGRCDERSLRILYVATLRTLGVPARLRPLDGAPQFWRDGTFHCAAAEVSGTLALTKTAVQSPLYRQNWSLSRWTGQGWKLLALNDGDWRDDHHLDRIPAGQYRLVTAVRLPNGNQFAAHRLLSLPPEGEAIAPLLLRSFDLADLLRCQDMLPVPATSLSGAAVPDATRQHGRPTLLFWMEEGGEPTEHVLNELLVARSTLKKMPVGVTFLLRSKESMRQPTLKRLCAGWPEIQVLFDDWAFDLDAAARHLACDPERPPLAVALNGGGQAVYAVSGYHVGSVELLCRIAALLCAQ